jgi:hypothetical protein
MSETKTILINGLGDKVSVTSVDGAISYALLGADGFTGTVKFRIRPEKDVDNADWVGDAGYQDVATHTADTDPSSDSLTTNVMGGVWHGQLICTAHSAGSIKGAIGARNNE